MTVAANGVTMSTLVVVGNAKPQKDLADVIDQSAVVIRFNHTSFFETGWTGCKTTHLCLFGLPYPQAGEIPRLNALVVESCASIWVEIESFVEPLVKGYKIPREKIHLNAMRSVQDRYAKTATPITAPSSGFQVLRYLVNSPEHALYRKFICGFEWRGGGVHQWELEREQATHYLRMGLLERLDG